MLNKIAYISLVALVSTFSVSASAQDLGDVGQLDIREIRKLVCMTQDTNSPSQSSLDNIGSILNQTLALYSEQVSQQQLQSAQDQARKAVAKLNLDRSTQQLCNSNQD